MNRFDTTVCRFLIAASVFVLFVQTVVAQTGKVQKEENCPVLKPYAELDKYLKEAAYSAAIFGHSEEALALARRAVELDPLNPHSWSGLGEIEYCEGRLAAAEADVKKSLELSPDVWPGPLLLSRIYVVEGRPQDALPEIERVRSDYLRVFLYAVTYHALGREKESDAALKELIAKHGAASVVAWAYAFRNQRDEAFEWLDRAYAQHEGNVAYTNVEPMLKNLRSDPRCPAFLEKLNLPN